jgi:hypothetical protein
LLFASAGWVALLSGCGGAHTVCAGGNGFCEGTDAAVVQPDASDAGVIVESDACAFCDAAYVPDVEAPSTEFFLLASQSTTTPSSNPADWYGVARFDFSADFVPAVQSTGSGRDIDKTLVQDPFGLAFAKTTAEVFIGNRAGNTAGGGNIMRFVYDKKTKTFTQFGSPITGNGVADVHQVALNTTEDQLFVATNNAGLPKFKLVNNTWTANGMFCNPGDWTRGVAVAPDGKRLYVSTAGTVIRQFDLTTNTEILPMLQVPSSNNLHFMTVCSDPKVCPTPQLYVGDAGTGTTQSGGIYRFDIGTNDDLTVVSKTAAGPTFSVALSPDGQELFAGSAYAGNLIKRFKNVNNSWVDEQKPMTMVGDIMSILVFPSDATPIYPPN